MEGGVVKGSMGSINEGEKLAVAKSTKTAEQESNSVNVNNNAHTFFKFSPLIGKNPLNLSVYKTSQISVMFAVSSNFGRLSFA